MDKAPDAFRTISEVAEDLDLPQHVLRFWETRFAQIRPMKRGGGRRYYRPDDVDLLRGIRHLLYGEGYTIRGVQRILKEQGVKFVQGVWHEGAVLPATAADDDELAEEGIDAGVAEDEAAERGRGLLRILPSLMRDEEGAGAYGLREPALHSDRIHVAAATADEDRRATLAPPLGGLPREDLRKLEATLHELGECRRLIEAALSE